MNCSSESTIVLDIVFAGSSEKQPITLVVVMMVGADFEMENFLEGKGGEKIETVN
jgi:hypothetical protein